MQVQSEDKPYDDINITPMLDLAYVLLVIFILMCTASVAGTKVNLPTGSSKPAKIQNPIKPKAITLDNEGRVTLEGVPVTSLDELEQRLTQYKAQSGDFPVIVRGASRTPYRSVVQVLNVVGALGLNQVALPTKASGAK